MNEDTIGSIKGSGSGEYDMNVAVPKELLESVHYALRGIIVQISHLSSMFFIVYLSGIIWVLANIWILAFISEFMVKWSWTHGRGRRTEWHKPCTHLQSRTTLNSWDETQREGVCTENLWLKLNLELTFILENIYEHLVEIFRTSIYILYIGRYQRKWLSSSHCPHLFTE